MRLIDADELGRHKFLTPDAVEAKKWLPKETKAYQQGWNEAIDAIIDNAPTVVNEMLTPERPQGEWKALGFVPSRRYAWCTCSNCGKTTKIYLDNNDFCCITDIRNKAVACLYCGADMRGGRE